MHVHVRTRPVLKPNLRRRETVLDRVEVARTRLLLFPGYEAFSPELFPWTCGLEHFRLADPPSLTGTRARIPSHAVPISTRRCACRRLQFLGNDRPLQQNRGRPPLSV